MNNRGMGDISEKIQGENHEQTIDGAVSQQQKDLLAARKLGDDVKKYVTEWYADMHTGEYERLNPSDLDSDYDRNPGIVW